MGKEHTVKGEWFGGKDMMALRGFSSLLHVGAVIT
jgi:hypothetical protein